MSKYTLRTDTGQFLSVEYDRGKVFIWENRYEKGDYTNSTYDTEDLLLGTVMGRVATTQKFKKWDPDAVDGSEYPVGILAENFSIDEGDTDKIMVCVAGDVVENKLVLPAGKTLNTVVSGRSLRDRIAADTVGIKLVKSTDHTTSDNY